MQSRIRSHVAIADRYASGDLTAKLTPVSDRDKLGISVSTMGESLATIVKEKADLIEDVQLRSEALRKKNEQLASLNRVATELSRCTTSTEALSTGLRLASEATGLPAGVIWLLGPGDTIELAASCGVAPKEDSLLADLPDRSPALRQAILSCQPLLLDRARTQELLLTPDRAHLAPAVSLVAPLLSRGNVMGALGLYRIAGDGYTNADLDLAEAIAAEIGVTLDNARRFEEVRELADRDSVTGLLNHRAFHTRLDQEFKRARRSGHELSVVMMDINGFKLFNDTYGHPAGDRILRDVAGLLSQAVRAGDILARYGGDEFSIVLPETGDRGALALAERCREFIAGHAFASGDGLDVPIRTSLGVASYPKDARHSQELLGFADANLFNSKRAGGNIVSGCDAAAEQENLAHAGSFGILDGLVTAVDNKDHYTRQHSEDVTTYALAIARELGWSEESQRTLRIAGLLHDVGKIGVPDRILRKPGRLEPIEYGIIQQHASVGEIIIQAVPSIGEVGAAVSAHHERFDGQGYPRGQREEEIPVMGRILAVADTYSAMTTDRPYRKALSPEEARAELLRVAGSQLDPEMVRVFVGLFARPLAMAGASPGQGPSGTNRKQSVR